MISFDVEQIDFDIFAGVLTYRPGDDSSFIAVHAGLPKAEQEATALALQLAFNALPDVQKLFPVNLHVLQRGVLVAFEDLKGIAGMLKSPEGSDRAWAIINRNLDETTQAILIAKARAFWASLTDEQRAQPIKAVL